MANYWIGIMAVAFAIALVGWLSLVFLADRHPGGKPQDSTPRREVIGGAFEARQGGRQLMPDPTRPPVLVPEGTEPGASVPVQAAGEPSMAEAGPQEPAAAEHGPARAPSAGAATAQEQAGPRPPQPRLGEQVNQEQPAGPGQSRSGRPDE